jgi:hypothetical protein
MNGDDRNLYESFHALRREIEAGVPPPSLPTLAAHDQRRPRASARLVAAATCLAALIVAALALLPGLRRSHHPPNPGSDQTTASITAWKPATDFLLDTPGHALLDTVPSIGTAQGMAIESTHRPSQNHATH